MRLIFVALSVLASVSVSVLLKLVPRFGVDVRQAIGMSYLVAVVLSFLFFGAPERSGLLAGFEGASRGGVSLLALGVLLPSMFLVLARSVVLVGMARTDAAQRLSLLLPLVAAFTLFGEQLTAAKFLGMVLGLFAIVLIVVREKGGQLPQGGWQWPLLVFVGMGGIDILFKLVAQQVALPFSAILLPVFAEAALLALFYVAALFGRGLARWHWRNLLMALLLGGFNFSNIALYIMAHRHLSQSPALVFSGMNIGVVVLASIIGVLFFREQLGRASRAGLGLAVVAVATLAFG